MFENSWSRPLAASAALLLLVSTAQAVTIETVPVGNPDNDPDTRYDQGGNGWEWNEAILYDDYRGLRGGSFYDNDDNLHASYRYSDGYPTDEDYTFGFRVASIPEPSTVVLAAFGLLCVLWWRKVAG